MSNKSSVSDNQDDDEEETFPQSATLQRTITSVPPYTQDYDYMNALDEQYGASQDQDRHDAILQNVREYP